MPQLSPLAALPLIALLAAPAPARQSSCSPQWLPTFGGYPLAPANDASSILAETVFDDGHGPALFAALSSAGAALLRWDGWGWKNVANTSAGRILSLAVHDFGSGPRLYAAGEFTSIGGVSANHVASFDGSTWSPLGSGTVGGYVSSLCVFDDGSGTQLYAGGSFSSAGGFVSANIARWNGTSWSGFTTGLDGPVRSLAVHDDGSGSALYAGGDFTHAGALVCNRVARWDAAGWSALGSGMAGGVQGATTVRCFSSFDDGTGTALYAGGVFTSAGGTSASRIARWDGSSWSAVGSGTDGEVSALQPCVIGGAAVLVAGGAFANAGGSGASAIASWNGAAWQPIDNGVRVRLNNGNPAVRSLCVFDDGNGSALFAGGHFDQAGSVAAGRCARLGPSGWSAPGSGLEAAVECLAVYDDGSGKSIYAGGSFLHAGSDDLRALARWNGTSWSPLPANPYSLMWYVSSLAVFDDGSGPALFVSEWAGPAELTKFDGTSWHFVQTPLTNIRDMKVLDDGSGPALYCVATGSGIGVYRWNGSSWTNLGGANDGIFLDLEMFDDGSGPALHAAGTFTSIGGQAVNGIAKWTGTGWSPLGSGVAGSYPRVQCLAVYDDGTGPALYAGGQFDTAGGLTANGIARWDGTNWSVLGSGMGVPSNKPTVTALAVFDDGAGARLFAGGYFLSAGGTPTNGLAKWDGSSWTDLGLCGGEVAPYSTWIYSMLVADDGSPTGPSLLVSGAFSGAYRQDSCIAKWDLPLGCMPIGTPICSPGIGGVSACPCANPPAGARLGCDNSAATGGAHLATNGLASLAHDAVAFASSGEPASALSVLLSATSTNPAGALLGQGVSCLAGPLRRLYARSAVNGVLVAPIAGESGVAQRSAALGDTIVAGQHRYYGVWYRDPLVLGGCPATSTFNLTQQVDLVWNP